MKRRLIAIVLMLCALSGSIRIAHAEDNSYADGIAQHIRAGDMERAIAEADKAMLALRAEYPPEQRPQHCFRDQASALLFAQLNTEEYDEVPYDFAFVPYLKAYALLELDRPEEAIGALKEAIALDPTGPFIRFELIANYEKMRMLDAVEQEIRDLWPLLIYPEDFAKYYRRMGFWLIEQNAHAQARHYFIYSLVLENNDLAWNELAYIDQQLGEKVADKLSDEDERDKLTHLAIETVTADGQGLELSDAQKSVMLSIALMENIEGKQDMANAMMRFALLNENLQLPLSAP